MAGNFPTRNFPTLTEVVHVAASPAVLPIASAAPAAPFDPPALAPSHEQQVDAVLDRLAPALELELRRSAHALLDVQLNSILPELHRQIEQLVRNAMDESRSP